MIEGSRLDRGGRASWPARVGVGPGGAKAGDGWRWPIGRLRALEDEPNAPGHSGARAELS